MNAGAFVRDLLDGMETCNSDCTLFLTLRRTPDDISEFLDIFNVPFCHADSVQLADVKDTLQEFATSLELNSNIIENLEMSTRGQGVNVNWKRARSVVVTASHNGQHCEKTKTGAGCFGKSHHVSHIHRWGQKPKLCSTSKITI